MTPVGSELDAAVLRAIGYKLRRAIDDPDSSALYFVENNGFTVREIDGSISTDHNGHEALRLCGPWLDERCTYWSVISGENTTMIAELRSGGMIVTERAATRAKAICDLVLAVAERETTNTKGTSNGSQS